jgi:hypothetical protein
MPGDANAGQTDEATKNNSFLNYLRNEIDQFSINSRQQENEPSSPPTALRQQHW